MIKVNELSFEGETIYVGLDVHKTNWKVHVRFSGGRTLEFSQNPEASGLIRTLNNKFPKATFKVAYEAGFCGFGICRYLKAEGIDCIVANAADIPASDKDRKRKDDKRDARKISLELSKGSLEGIYIPETEIEKVRALVRLRATFVKDQTAAINRLKHYLHCYGIVIDEKVNRISNRILEKLESFEGESAVEKNTRKLLIRNYKEKRALVLEATKDIRKLSQSESLNKTQALLKSIDGVGPVTAMVIQTEIMDIKRFKNNDRLKGYLGFVPDISSSNDRTSILGMTRRANSFLRAVLIEASWTAIRKDPALLKLYQKYSLRMNKNKAIIRIASHLLARIRAVWLTGKPYERGVIAKNAALAAP
ncbi:MAG TPA: IS110 family transposase [Flavitalea sp.]|nr:IS110 family transposase [Flavitalea sp.]HMI79232.1 IS110 family transposase [Ferruginibacter sp.]